MRLYCVFLHFSRVRCIYYTTGPNLSGSDVIRPVTAILSIYKLVSKITHGPKTRIYIYTY